MLPTNLSRSVLSVCFFKRFHWSTNQNLSLTFVGHQTLLVLCQVISVTIVACFFPGREPTVQSMCVIVHVWKASDISHMTTLIFPKRCLEQNPDYQTSEEKSQKREEKIIFPEFLSNLISESSEQIVRGNVQHLNPAISSTCLVL